MINGKRIAVVMPAYNAEKTLEQTVRELTDLVDIKILVDDSSKDKTAELSRRLGVETFVHDANYGYGRNQQTCYREALNAGADICSIDAAVPVPQPSQTAIKIPKASVGTVLITLPALRVTLAGGRAARLKFVNVAVFSAELL